MKKETIIKYRILIFLFLIILISIISLFIHLRLREYAFDDAYIHFRIVDNIIERGEPYFNEGERVKTSTSTGWTILLFVLFEISRLVRMDVNLPTLVAILNALLVVANALVYTVLISKLVQNRNSTLNLSIIFLVIFSFTLYPSVGLMETIAALLLAGLALLLYVDQNKVSFTLLGVSIFFRPELIILFCLIIIHALFTKRFSFPKVFTFSLIGVLPFILFDLYFYETVVPNSVTAKSILYSLGYRDVISIFFGRISNYYYLFPFFSQFPKIYFFFILFIIVLFISLFLSKILKNSTELITRVDIQFSIIILLWGLFTFGAYLLRRTYIFPWYDPLYLVPIVIIISKTILDSPTHQLYKLNRSFASPVVVGQIIIVCIIAFSAIINPAFYIGFSEGARVRQYIQIAEELYQQYPNSVLMTSEIGGLGYGFRGTILDAGGLASPEAQKYHPLKIPDERSHGGIGAIPVGFVRARNPDIIVSYDIFIESLLKSDIGLNYTVTKSPLFLEDDRLNIEIKMPWSEVILRTLWGAEYLYIYTLKD